MRPTCLNVLSVVVAFVVVLIPSSSSAQSASAAPAQMAAHGQYVLCYSDAVASTSPFYLSADFQIDVPVAPDAQSGRSDGGASRNALDALQKEFLEYLKADRGYKVTSSFPSTCQGKPTLAELAVVRDLLHQRFPQLKFIETGWKPGVKPTATPKPSATPSPSASPVMSAYDKAIAAGRPASNTPTPTPSPSAAAKPAVPPAVVDPPKYAYCYAYGATTAGKQHFYVSQAFQVAPGERLNEGFEKYLGALHPGEEINASCLAPVALDAAQANRQTTLDNRRKQPAKWDVIEMVWKRLP